MRNVPCALGVGFFFGQRVYYALDIVSHQGRYGGQKRRVSMRIKKEKAVLITGGAGYVGSHTAYLMARQGYKVFILDTRIHGQPFSHNWATLIEKDCADREVLSTLFERYDIEGVVHFAALAEVSESVRSPQDYYENNVVKTLQLIDCMLQHKVKRFVFSSTCAVYGEPTSLSLSETHPTAPINPYGRTKLAIEHALHDYSHAYGLSYVSLRYFNAAGALPEMQLGEYHVPETHLIPRLIRSLYQQEPFFLFGNDYKTKDGSCVRDYVHVIDIARAHLQAWWHLASTGVSECINLGSTHGHSVKDVIRVLEDICGKKVLVKIADRRLGDPAILVADATKAMNVLGWHPKYSSLSLILRSALRWEEANHFFSKVTESRLQW